MIFKSAVDRWLIVLGFLLPVALVLVALFFAAPLPARDWVIFFLVLVPSLGLPVWLFLSTRYEVSEAVLLVRSGPFRWRIPRAEITSVTPSHSLLSSPALSLDRLEIRYGKGRVVLVSPKDKEGFKAALGFTN